MAILVQSNKKPSVSFPSQTGSIVTFNSKFAGLPLKSHTVDVDYTGSAISRVNVTHRNELILTTIIENSNIDASGVVYSTTVYDLVIAPIIVGDKYYIKTQDTDLVCGFFTTIPSEGDITFNNSRTVLSLNTPITSPINGYIAFRKTHNTTGEMISTYYKNYFITFPTPIYGGSYDCLTGIVTSNKDSGGSDVTPTYQQTATANCEINLGTNNIWADTGDTTVQYIKIGG